jgi:hypothetical protein
MNNTLGVGAILLLFISLGFWYSLAVPPFEAPDELFHYAFARHLAQGNPLPVQKLGEETLWEQEGSQAPLYYWVVGRLTASIDQNDFDQLRVRNPRANIGDPLFPGNKNFMLYSAAPHPLVGSNLALHVGRWFSLLLGALTLLCTYATARLVFPHAPHLALVTLLLAATLPQFTFISAALTNDTLITAASAAVVYWLARLLQEPFQQVQSSTNHERERAEHDRPLSSQLSPSLPAKGWGGMHRAALFVGAPLTGNWVKWIILGLLLGIAALSKLQGLGLFLLSALVGLWIAWQQRDWRLPLRVFLPVAAPALAMAGWWYWRNHTLYDDWLGVGSLLAINGQRPSALTLSGFWQEFRGLRYSFWGLFGWFNLLLPTWVYTVLDIATLSALGGLVLSLMCGASDLRRQTSNSPQPTARVSRQSSVVLLLALWVLLSLVLILYWASRATGSQGRLLFPALNAFAVLWVVGWNGWVRHLPVRWQPLAWLGLPALLLGCSLYTLIVLLPASYGAPALLATLPNSARPLDVTYGNQERIHLLGLEIPQSRYTEGEHAPVTLYLQAPQPMRGDYQLFIQFLDERGVEVGNLTSHPAWGRNPTSLWQPGAIYADAYPVLISGPLASWSPLLARVYVGFVDPETEESGRFPVPARTSRGEEITPFVAEIVIRPRWPPDLSATPLTPSGVEFGQVIQLAGHHYVPTFRLAAASTLTVTLVWDALGAPATDYTAFVHLRTPAGGKIAGFDQAPAGGRFPTHVWAVGDRVVSRFGLAMPTDLPAGEYNLWAGLYETASRGVLRLPVTDPAGQVTGDGDVWLGVVTVDG